MLVVAGTPGYPLSRATGQLYHCVASIIPDQSETSINNSNKMSYIRKWTIAIVSFPIPDQNTTKIEKMQRDRESRRINSYIG